MGLESPNDNETLPPLLEVVDNLETASGERYSSNSTSSSTSSASNNSNLNAAAAAAGGKLGISLASDKYDNKTGRIYISQHFNLLIKKTLHNQ